MQEVLPFAVNLPHSYPDLKAIGKGLKQIMIVAWKPIHWFFVVIFTPPPGQEYIEESRARAMRLMGHF